MKLQNVIWRAYFLWENLGFKINFEIPNHWLIFFLLIWSLYKNEKIILELRFTFFKIPQTDKYTEFTNRIIQMLKKWVFLTLLKIYLRID